MRRPRSHQIDELAQRTLRESLPPSWVLNEQHRDYGKDYLVEIVEDNGDLSGDSFYVQLKGQQEFNLTRDGKHARYSLKTKHASYYLDKVRDLPVFLILVDVSRKHGCWLFLQPELDTDKPWRHRKTFTIYVPVDNDLGDSGSFQSAIHEAKKWLRLRHPESIQDAFDAHRERVQRADPRFDVDLFHNGDKVGIRLRPIQDIEGKMTFTGSGPEMTERLKLLFDQGQPVPFGPGEVKITGSNLFEHFEQTGGEVQIAVDFEGTVSLTCNDSEGTPIAELADLAGRFTGGQKEWRYEGVLEGSPLAISLGPVVVDSNSRLTLRFDAHRWDNQHLLRLAYFDKIHRFWTSFVKSTSTRLQCQRYGNNIFGYTFPYRSEPFFEQVAYFLETLSKARAIARKFSIDPIWNLDKMDDETLDTIDKLYAVYFEDGWSKPSPGRRFRGVCIKSTMHPNAEEVARGPGPFMVTSNVSYSFLGEVIDARLQHEFSNMRFLGFEPHVAEANESKSDDLIDMLFAGTDETVVTIRAKREE